MYQNSGMDFFCKHVTIKAAVFFSRLNNVRDLRRLLALR